MIVRFRRLVLVQVGSDSRRWSGFSGGDLTLLVVFRFWDKSSAAMPQYCKCRFCFTLYIVYGIGWGFGSKWTYDLRRTIRKVWFINPVDTGVIWTSQRDCAHLISAAFFLLHVMLSFLGDPCSLSRRPRPINILCLINVILTMSMPFHRLSKLPLSVSTPL